MLLLSNQRPSNKRRSVQHCILVQCHHLLFFAILPSWSSWALLSSSLYLLLSSSMTFFLSSSLPLLLSSSLLISSFSLPLLSSTSLIFFGIAFILRPASFMEPSNLSLVHFELSSFGPQPVFAFLCTIKQGRNMKMLKSRGMEKKEKKVSFSHQQPTTEFWNKEFKHVFGLGWRFIVSD